jgi:hypothetical protein
MAETNNRCWPGYEPVKGKRAHSEGSCRPKADSKLAPSEREFRAERKRQLDDWQEEHPGTRRQAAQHLSAPDTKKKGTGAAAEKSGKNKRAETKSATNAPRKERKPSAQKKTRPKRATKSR